VRRNDRDYRVGDRLHLREWRPVSTAPEVAQGYTGYELRAVVTYALYGSGDWAFAQANNPHKAIQEGWVVLGLKFGD
jgi:hypothetical protein